jgi:hypothetical protein
MPNARPTTKLPPESDTAGDGGVGSTAGATGAGAASVSIITSLHPASRSAARPILRQVWSGERAHRRACSTSESECGAADSCSEIPGGGALGPFKGRAATPAFFSLVLNSKDSGSARVAPSVSAGAVGVNRQRNRIRRPVRFSLVSLRSIKSWVCSSLHKAR